MIVHYYISSTDCKLIDIEQGYHISSADLRYLHVCMQIHATMKVGDNQSNGIMKHELKQKVQSREIVRNELG